MFTNCTTGVMKATPLPASSRCVVPSSRFRADMASVLEVVDGGGRVIIERRGRKPVVLVSIDDLMTLELLEAKGALGSV